MKHRKKEDPTREKRIDMEIVVDSYGPEERAMGWYCHLDSTLHFPFLAPCVSGRMISPLHVGDEVEAIAMPPEEECEHEMFVTIEWEERGPAGPAPADPCGCADAGGRGGLAVLGPDGLPVLIALMRRLLHSFALPVLPPRHVSPTKLPERSRPVDGQRRGPP